MPARDFFAFCTSLPPIELRALGVFSQVRHVAAGETIYAAGEPSDTFFIINRGTVEVLPAAPKGTAPVAQLTRGAILGDLEVLTERPRPETARTCEPVSLQCFRRQDFTELQRRVPSFFCYLAEELAHRLVQAQIAAGLPNLSMELSGSLANFDVVTIYQTIVHSSKTGELSIANEGGQQIAIFHFEEGEPRAGRFDHLTGEEAFWQLFLAADLRGTFSFSSDDNNQTQPRGQTITRRANDMLIAAVQLRDEFQSLQAEMSPTAFLEVQKPILEVDAAASGISLSLMERIWRCTRERRITLSDLYPLVPVCEMKIYQAVHVLLRTEHLALSLPETPQKVA